MRLDEAELHTGKHVKREVVEHPGGVTVLPVDSDGNCYLVRQFRYPFGDYQQTVEVPVSPTRIVSTSPAVTEIIYALGAEKLLVGRTDFCVYPPEAESIESIGGISNLNVEKIPLKELSERVMQNEIDDGKTIVAILKAEKYLQNRL